MKTIPSLIKWAFAAAFIIITNLFFYNVISFISPEPKLESYCPTQTQNEQYTSAEICVNAGGQWENFNLSSKDITESVKNNAPTGWCDAQFTCRQEYDKVNSIYNKNVFMAMIAISVIMIIGGVFVTVEVLSIGMVWSGVLALLIATIRYWSDANNLMKVVILGIGIGVLTWLAVKKMNHKE